jgi:hypothetical protein
MTDIGGPRFIIKHQSGRTYDSEASRSTSRDVDHHGPHPFSMPGAFLASAPSCEPLSPPALQGFVPTCLSSHPSREFPFALPRSVSIYTAAWRFLFWAGFYLDRRCAGRATPQLHPFFISYKPRFPGPPFGRRGCCDGTLIGPNAI